MFALHGAAAWAYKVEGASIYHETGFKRWLKHT